MADIPRFRSKADRDLMAFAMAMDPNMKEHVMKLFRMKVRNIRADYMTVKVGDGSSTEQYPTGYDHLPDPGAWSGDITPHVGVMLLRTRKGEWWLNGF